jgi:predicted RNA-binding Zn-ribbon protein involved in translation (DUF1610 family)
MPSRKKLDHEAIRASLGTNCPHCGTRITPDEYKRVDGEHLECPKCGEHFIPNRGKRK